VSLRLTNSEASGWRRCRRKWYLGTYRRLAPDKGPEFHRPLSIGSRFHEVLASYYQPGVYGEPEYAMQILEATTQTDLILHPTLEDEILKEDALVTAMVEGYFEWLAEEGADMDLNVIASESEMEQPLIDGATILSKLDVRVERLSDKKRGNLEHKSVGSLTEPVRKLQVDTQLLTEHLVEFLHLVDEGKVENRAEFVLYNMARKVKRTATAKPPFYARHEVRHNVDELRSHWRHYAQQAREIMRATELLDSGIEHHDVCYPNPTGDCHWECPFTGLCLTGMMDDGSDWEAAVAADYKQVDPLERYVSQGVDSKG